MGHPNLFLTIIKPACNQLYEEFEVAAAGNFYEALTAAAGLDRDTALQKT